MIASLEYRRRCARCRTIAWLAAVGSLGTITRRGGSPRTPVYRLGRHAWRGRAAFIAPAVHVAATMLAVVLAASQVLR